MDNKEALIVQYLEGVFFHPVYRYRENEEIKTTAIGAYELDELPRRVVELLEGSNINEIHILGPKEQTSYIHEEINKLNNNLFIKEHNTNEISD